MSDKGKAPSEREIQLLGLVTRERNGREIAAEAERRGTPIPFGTIYTLLSQMEKRGWVSIRTIRQDARERLYRIKPGGRVALSRACDEHRRLSKMAEDALR